LQIGAADKRADEGYEGSWFGCGPHVEIAKYGIPITEAGDLIQGTHKGDNLFHGGPPFFYAIGRGLVNLPAHRDTSHQNSESLAMTEN
jgi:hypothetical protein